MFDWRKELRLMVRVGETSVFRTLLGSVLVILLVDFLKISGLMTMVLLIPVSFTANYIYGRARGVYNYSKEVKK